MYLLQRPVFRLVIRLLLVVLLLPLASACGGAAEEPASTGPAAEPAPTGPAAEPDISAGLSEAVLEDPTRPAEERAEDADRKPLEVYELFEIDAGMTVADLWPGAGYNTHLLSHVVGDDGRVYSVLGFYNDFRDGEVAEQFRDRVAETSLDNVEIVDEIGGLPPAGIDVAITVRNYHDVYGFGGDPEQTVADIFAAMKPGGIVGVVDVAAEGPGWDEEAHRLGEETVVEDFTSGGFELVGSYDVLRNPDDPRTSTGFEQGRQTVDRYVLKFRKPAE